MSHSPSKTTLMRLMARFAGRFRRTVPFKTGSGVCSTREMISQRAEQIEVVPHLGRASERLSHRVIRVDGVDKQLVLLERDGDLGRRKQRVEHRSRLDRPERGERERGRWGRGERAVVKAEGRALRRVREYRRGLRPESSRERGDDGTRENETRERSVVPREIYRVLQRRGSIPGPE